MERDRVIVDIFAAGVMNHGPSTVERRSYFRGKTNSPFREGARNQFTEKCQLVRSKSARLQFLPEFALLFQPRYCSNVAPYAPSSLQKTQKAYVEVELPGR